MPTLTSVSVAGLLGHFDHHIDFPAEDSFVIIHGPNGVGKTHFLQLIDATLGRRFWLLRRIRFRSARFQFDSGHILHISRTMSGDRENNVRRATRIEVELRARLTLGRSTLATWKDDGRNTDSALDSPLRRVLEYELGFERVGPDDWFDPQTEQVLTAEDALARYVDPSDSLMKHAARISTPLPKEMEGFLQDGSVRFVETQRLLTMASNNDGPRRRGAGRVRRSTVAEFAKHLAKLISEKLAENSRISSQLDRSFPKRVFERSVPRNHTDQELLTRYRNQTELRNRLATVALLDSAPDIPLQDRKLDDMERRVLAIYLEDADRKLGAFEDTLRKITLFRDIINSRFLYKALRIDADQGFYFETDEGEQVSPDQLSSGEQHELVLLYELLFRTPERALVLIDEPEISLHVKWQREFISDLQAISDVVGLRFVIATHSPQIVHKWASKAVLLSPEDLD